MKITAQLPQEIPVARSWRAGFTPTAEGGKKKKEQQKKVHDRSALKNLQDADTSEDRPGSYGGVDGDVIRRD